MFLPPGIKSTDERGEAQATLGQAVFYPRRDFGVDFAENKSILFEFTEGLDEHLFAHSRNELLQFSVTLGPRGEVPEENGLPFADDKPECLFDGAVWFFLCRCHREYLLSCRYLYISMYACIMQG